MAEFKEVLKQRNRICKTISCDKCSLYYPNNKKSVSCSSFIVMYPDEAEKRIMEWAKENPIQTNKDKFIEVFGIDDVALGLSCTCFRCPDATECDECEYNDFWIREYRSPEKPKKMIEDWANEHPSKLT